MSKIDRPEKQAVHFQSLRPSDLNLTSKDPINLFSKDPRTKIKDRLRPGPRTI